MFTDAATAGHIFLEDKFSSDTGQDFVLYVATHKEIFGCNNLVSYKAATRLKISWICKVFYLVAGL